MQWEFLQRDILNLKTYTMGTKVTKETFLSSEMILALEAIKGSSVVAKKTLGKPGTVPHQ